MSARWSLRDLVQELEAPLREGPSELVPPGDELRDPPDVHRVRAQLDVSEPFRDHAGLARIA